MTVANTSMTEVAEDYTIVPVRESVAAEIKSCLDSIGQSYLRVGALLLEAREDFEDTREFLSWALVEFSIKKAQAYHLMNIAKNFKDDTRFTGVSMRVMLALIPMVDDAELMEKAAALAEKGNLTTNTVNELLGKPAVKLAVVGECEPNTKEPAEEVEVDSPVAVAARKHETYTKALLDSVEGREGEIMGDAKHADIPFAPDVPGVDASPNPTLQDTAMAGLLSQIKALTEQNAALSDRIAELSSTRESKKAAAPMLPQFKSSCMYARLGLSAEEAEKKTSVNKAKRELVKLGYGEGHEAWQFISEAVEALTK